MSRSHWTSLMAAAVFCLALVIAAPLAAMEIPTENEEEDTAYVEPWTVFVRSLVVPGWGQFHLDRDTAGTVYLTNAVIGVIIGSELVQIASSENSQSVLRTMGWLQFGFSALISSTSAWKQAEARNRENGWMLEVRRGLEGQPVVGLRWRF